MPRRYVPGSTAFKTMRGVPVLTKDQMTKVPMQTRESVFRGFVGADKFSARDKKEEDKKEEGAGAPAFASAQPELNDDVI